MHRAMVLLLWGLLTLAAAAVVLGIFATRPGIDLSDLPRVTVDDVAIARANEKVQAFAEQSERARATGLPVPVQLNWTQEELTYLARDWGRQGQWYGSVPDLQLMLVEGQMTLTGTFHVLGFEFPFRIDVAVRIENSQRVVEMTRLQVGQLFLPGFVRGVLLGLASRTVDAGVPRVPLTIESLVITNGEMLVSGAAIP